MDEWCTRLYDIRRTLVAHVHLLCPEFDEGGREKFQGVMPQVGMTYYRGRQTSSQVLSFEGSAFLESKRVTVYQTV